MREYTNNTGPTAMIGADKKTSPKQSSTVKKRKQSRYNDNYQVLIIFNSISAQQKAHSRRQKLSTELVPTKKSRKTKEVKNKPSQKQTSGTSKKTPENIQQSQLKDAELQLPDKRARKPPGLYNPTTGKQEV